MPTIKVSLDYDEVLKERDREENLRSPQYYTGIAIWKARYRIFVDGKMLIDVKLWPRMREEWEKAKRAFPGSRIVVMRLLRGRNKMDEVQNPDQKLDLEGPSIRPAQPFGPGIIDGVKSLPREVRSAGGIHTPRKEKEQE